MVIMNEELQQEVKKDDKNGEGVGNIEKALPKLSASTDFEKSVSEIEQLLGISEVKLPKVGDKPATSGDGKLVDKKPATEAKTEDADVAALAATTASGDKEAEFRQRATELGKEAGRVSNGAETTAAPNPSLARPEKAADMTKEQAQAFYPNEYKGATIAGANEGYTEKLVAQAKADEAIQKKKEEDAKSGKGPDGAAYQAGESRG